MNKTRNPGKLSKIYCIVILLIIGVGTSVSAWSEQVTPKSHVNRGANVRDNVPDAQGKMDAQIIGGLFPGQKARFIEEQRGWYRVELNDCTTGWVNKTLLEEPKGTSEPTLCQKVRELEEKVNSISKTKLGSAEPIPIEIKEDEGWNWEAIFSRIGSVGAALAAFMAVGALLYTIRHNDKEREKNRQQRRAKIILQDCTFEHHDPMGQPGLYKPKLTFMNIGTNSAEDFRLTFAIFPVDEEAGPAKSKNEPYGMRSDKEIFGQLPPDCNLPLDFASTNEIDEKLFFVGEVSYKDSIEQIKLRDCRFALRWEGKSGARPVNDRLTGVTHKEFELAYDRFEKL